MPAAKKSQLKPDRFIASLCLLAVVCLVLLFGRIIVTDSSRYIFLLWNLILAVIPLLLAWWLVNRVRAGGWLKWPQIGLGVLWLTLLPNCFYMITDFVHLRPNYEADLMFDIVLLTSFLLAGLIFGLLSIYLMHVEIIKKLKPHSAMSIVAGVLLVSSFAVYLGRFNRWNSWDIFFQPAGLLFDVSERFVNPAAHYETYLTTIIFFIMLFSIYLVFWEGTKLFKK